MKKNKVSVIVPIYNVGKYVRKCVESLMNQTYSNLEIILVDDGSTDSSGIICDELSELDDRIIVVHKKNAGVSSARNTGIDMATGDYICFVDGDDFVISEYVEYMLNLTLEHNADVTVSSKVFNNFNDKQFQNNKVEVLTGELATEAILCYRLPIGVYAKIFKRSFLNKENLRFISELVIGEGFNFNTACFQRANKVVVGYRKIYFYRKDNPTSVTTLYSNKKWENGLYALERIKEDFLIRTDRINKAWNYANWRTHSDAYDLLVIAKATKKYPEMYERCNKIIRKGFFYSLKVPVSFNDKLRAFVLMIYPKLIPFAMLVRRKIYKVKV